MYRDSKMYQLYLDGILFPVAPAKIEWNYYGRNETVSLIDQGELNLIRPGKLLQFSFQLLLPHQKYPFAYYPKGVFISERYYLERLQKMMENQRPVVFALVRPGTEHRHELKMVTLENYLVREDARESRDVIVHLDLKEFIPKKSVQYVAGPDGMGQIQIQGMENIVEVPSQESPQEYQVKAGDSLWRICREKYGDGSRCWDVARQNGLGNPNRIYEGQVIVLA